MVPPATAVPLRVSTATPLRDDAADTVRGILLVAGCYALLVAGDVAGKWALAPAGVALVMVGRGVLGLLTCAVITEAFSAAVPVGGPGQVRGLRRLVPRRWGMVLFRSALHSLVSIGWYAAWLFIPLAESYAVGFTAPLVMAVLAIPMLGERIRWRRALSTVLGFLGVLVMVRPGTALWSPALLVLLPAIVGMAVTRIMARQLSTTETPECLTFWLMAAHVPAGLLVLGVFPPADLGAMGWDVLAAIALLGVLNAAAHCLMARAYALAPVSALAPYEYTTLPWGGLFAWAAFGEVPAWSTLGGAAVVAAAGLYNLHRERVRRAEETRCPS